MATEFGVVDLSGEGSLLQGASTGSVDIDELRGQLEQIRAALDPVVAGEGGTGAVKLKTLEVTLTVSAEGRVLFVVKGSAEASIKLVWERS